MRTAFACRPRAALVRRALAPILFAALLGTLLLTRGHTVMLDCVRGWTPAAVAGTAVMPVMDAAAWFAKHPARGLNATAAPVDSFLAFGTYFEEKNNGAGVDTARIVQGDVILFKWVTGSHTVTSGTGGADPNSGALFNQPLNTSVRTFTFQFNDVGTFPFYCVFHESFNMKGIVVVSQNTSSVGPPPAAGEGFVRMPWPNPASGTSTFRFAQSRPGHVRVTVLDTQGRRVATPVDGSFGAGTFESRWNGRDASGTAAPPGVYLLRLELGGRAQATRLTVLR